ncbi:girdin-like [Synchiropus splendidus]|uniref:girdin-like n=1 Tax=Synchiropus splendidus TaxID=270530 RepID=UPI00237D3A92|nr:girdin-like [Synchiropus splendidus]
MESGVFLPCRDQFMLSPLVTWVKTFLPPDGSVHLDFPELMDGIFLNDVMNQINPPSPKAANKATRDPSHKVKNLNFLVQQIKTYYLDHLRQLIMIPVPNVSLLTKTPYCEQGLDEMKRLLLLLLGCAVQCEKKEEYIERIQTLDFDTKAAIAVHIQELTHSQENMLDLQWLESSDLHADELETLARNMAVQLKHLLDQRDAHLQTIVELTQEKDGVVSLLGCPSNPQCSGYSPGTQQQQPGTQQHLAVELADFKAKIRRLRQELEEKNEQMLDCRHELENMRLELKRIQQENSQLLVDARAARTYRDELDSLRERAIKADKLESEVGRYREQLHKIEFFKAKVEELKEDNRVLQETKEVLEDQLEGWRARSDKIHHLEKQSLLLKAQIHDLEQEREADRKRIEELQEENLSLCLAQRRSMEESQHLGWELEQLSKTTDSPQSHQTLSEEVSERARSRLLKLEKENQSLLRTIEDLRVASVRGSEQAKSANNGREPVCPESQSFHTCNGTNPELMLVAPCSEGSTPETMNGDIKNSRQECPDMRQLDGGSSCDHFQELISDVEILEQSQNRHHHGCVASHDSSFPRHDDVLPALPTRYCYANKQMQRLEAKCRNLDSLNQHLQTSLDNTERKVQHLEAEIQELEAENQTLHSTLEELRVSARRLEQMEVEKLNLEQENTSLEKDKRLLEKENRRLRQQTEIQEANLDSRNVCMTGLEREMRLLVKEVESLRETAERVKGLERDHRELTKQAAIDQRTLVNLREELVSEKLKTQQKDNELESLAHQLEVKLVNQESKQQHSATDNRFKMLESQLELSLKKSLQIKEDKMASLEARLQESSNLNQQLRQELKAVRLSYEALQQRQEEEETGATRTPPPKESGRAMSEMLRESHEATKELLKLKDHLIEVERNNATLEAERQAVQAHVRQLENQSDSLQAQILALQRQAASLQESNTALQTHNANLQVEKSTLNSQSASLMAQNAQLQQQQSGMEAERENAVRERDEQRGVHEQLLRDHERLAALHERQAMEYETMLGKHGCLKNAHRTLELEHRTLQDRYNSLLQQRSKLEELEKALKEEQMRMALEKEQHRTSAAECCRLRDEKDWLNQTYRQLLNDNEVLTADHKQLKSELNEAKLEHTWLEADFNKLKKEYQQLDISSTKLTNQCELLSQLKGNLEEENRHLLTQIETLMLQNRTLLEQTMESKDLFHVEERQYIDKLNDLRRQKEKLEEKIMDQYKFYEPSPPRRRGNWITLKLKKLIKSSSREHGLENTSTSAEGNEPQLYSGTIVSSDGSTSAGEVVSPQHRGSALKLFPRMRSRQKNRGRVKTLFQRSMSLSSLVFPSGPFEEERWSDEQLEGPGADVEEDTKDTLTPSLTTSIISIHHPHPTSSPSGCTTSSGADVPDVTELWVTDKDSNDSAAPSGPEDNDEPQNHGVSGVQSRAQSESSGEYSLSLDSEPWSNNSSPVQQLPSQQSCDSAASLDPSDKVKASTLPIARGQEHTPKTRTSTPNQDFWLTRGTKSIRRGSKAKLMRQSSEAAGVVAENPELKVDAHTAVSAPITVLYVQGKSSSMSGCLNCFSTPLTKEGRVRGVSSTKMLPRASSVISTADGSSRRSSVNSDCRVEPDSLSENTNSTDPPVNQDLQSGPVPPVKPPRDPALIDSSDCPKSPVQESLMGSSFTFNSVFSNTIFSDSVVTTATHLEQHCQTLHTQETPGDSSQTQQPDTDKCVINA